MNNFFFSLINAGIGLFFALVGVIGMMIPLDPTARTIVVQFIFENSIALFLFGFAFFVVGLFLVMGLFLSFKRRYYSLRSKGREIAVDEAVIQDYIDSYWKQLYPSCLIPCRTTLKKNKIHIYADLPYHPKEGQKEWMEQIRRDFAQMFNNLLDYKDSFYLNISFQRKDKRL